MNGYGDVIVGEPDFDGTLRAPKHGKERGRSSAGHRANVARASFDVPTPVAGERARFEVRSEAGAWKVVEVERKRVFGGTPDR